MADPTPEELYGVCSKGHVWSPENTLFESAGRKDGRRRRRCRTCRRNKRMEAAANAAKGIPSSNSSQVRRGRGEPERTYSAERAMVDFDYALKHITTPCMGDTSQFADFELEDAPTPNTAKKLCDPCVLRDLCRERAEAEPPAWCVWGGAVWVEGRIYTEGTT